MKNYIILLSLSFFLAGCSNEKSTPFETVTKYYDALHSSDYSQIRILINDSLTIVDGEYATTYSQNSFYEQFKWDSIFQPTYEVVEIADVNNQMIATVASYSLRYEFLKNNPLTCKYKISLNSGKISKIEAIDFVGADWKAWQKERDSLVIWINNNHPELDGFIHDLTMNGAINYLKAIELYENSKDVL